MRGRSVRERPDVDDWARGIGALLISGLFSFCLIGAPLSIGAAAWWGEGARWPAAWAGTAVLPIALIVVVVLESRRDRRKKVK